MKTVFRLRIPTVCKAIFGLSLNAARVTPWRVISMRQNRVKGGRFTKPVGVLSGVYLGWRMNINKVFLLSRSVGIGKRVLALNGGKEFLLHQHRRSIRTHPRNLAYAKDLFLGQINKVTKSETSPGTCQVSKVASLVTIRGFKKWREKNECRAGTEDVSREQESIGTECTYTLLSTRGLQRGCRSNTYTDRTYIHYKQYIYTLHGQKYVDTPLTCFSHAHFEQVHRICCTLPLMVWE